MAADATHQSDKSMLDADAMHEAHFDLAYRQNLEASPLATYLCNAKGFITYSNTKANILWGRSPEPYTEKWSGAWKSYLMDGTPVKSGASPISQILTGTKTQFADQILIERPDHTFLHLKVYGARVFRNNLMIGVWTILVDITDEKSQLDKYASLAAIVESSDDAIVSKTLQSIITSWNSGAERLFGYKAEEIIGKPIHILIPRDMHDEVDNILENIKTGNKIDHFETIRLSKDGRKIPVSLTVSPVRDFRGQIVGASKIARDISEQREKEKQIFNSARRLEILNSIGKVLAYGRDSELTRRRVTEATTGIINATLGVFIYHTFDGKGSQVTQFTSSGSARSDFEQKIKNIDIPFVAFSRKSVERFDDILNLPLNTDVHPHISLIINTLPVASFMSVPVMSLSGSVVGYLCFAHPHKAMFSPEHQDLVENIAGQAAVSIENSNLLEELTALNSRKDEFIALAGHELRTPLTSARGYFQMIQMTGTDPGELRFIEKGIKQLDKLNELIADLLDISQMESGTLSLDPQVFDLRQLVTDVTDDIRYAHTTHDISVFVPDHPVFVNADIHRIEQVLVNLLTNAVKYAPDNPQIEVRMSITETGVVVSVIDQGIGLSSEQQQKLFQRYYRAQHNSNIPGKGLGLYLTRKILDMHNSKIEVSSAPGKGSIFSFILDQIADPES